jgi:hypothetical protein
MRLQGSLVKAAKMPQDLKTVGRQQVPELLRKELSQGQAQLAGGAVGGR